MYRYNIKEIFFIKKIKKIDFLKSLYIFKNLVYTIKLDFLIKNT